MGSALVGLALVAAACGGDDGDGTTSGTVDEGVRGALQGNGSDTTTGGTVVEQPTTIEGWRELAESERQRVVERIGSEGWGKEGNTVTGPEGFTIDLSNCEAGWSDTNGLTDTEIKIGHTTALSGTLADYGNIAKAMEAMLAEVNAAGGITDSTGKARQVRLIVKDDGYDANRTIPLVDELIDSEGVFAMITLGSPNTLKTYDKLNRRCIPQPLSMTGHPAWGDPVNHPWTTGQQLAYNTEAVIWGDFIDRNFDELAGDDGKVTVGALVMNNDFGKSYIAAFQDYVASSENSANIVVETETIEPQAPTVTDPMTTITSKQPDVFIAMVAGTPCTQAIQEAAQNGLKQEATYLFQPSVCKASSFVGRDKVGGDGMAADGWWIVGGGVKDLNAPQYDDDPYVTWARDQLRGAGLDPARSGSFGSGYFFGHALIESLRIAAELEGGLTRSNLILALRSMDISHPMLLPGIRFNMNGNSDAYFVEGSELARYDAASQSWEQQGEVLELSGRSKPCAWDQGAGICR